MAKSETGDFLLPLLLIGGGVYLWYTSQRPQPPVTPLRLAHGVPLPRPIVSPGGINVSWVQDSLNKIIGAGLVVDGILGPKTTTMIKTYQGMAGIPASGVVDAATEAAIRTDLQAKEAEY